MENQGNHVNGELEADDFADEFQCCVCLDLMYKPVVLACGHISCFWCVFKTMNKFQESHCPICRNPYNHFPSICKLLHLLLMILYPSAYKRRDRQVAEDEKSYGDASPQLDNDLIDSQLSEVLDVRGTSSPLLGVVSLESNVICGGDHLLPQGSSSRASPCEDKPLSIPTPSSEAIVSEVNRVVEHSNQILAIGACVKCAVCKHLLCRPVVLNCGHVCCEACIDPLASVCKCPICQSAHPTGFPNVCLVLEHFLEERFPEEYLTRKQSLPSFRATPSGSSAEKPKQEPGVQLPPVLTNECPPGMSCPGPSFHPMVGCDYCGMCPIIGIRYKCEDCVEKIGFDLCAECYHSSSKRPGRFNQQHTEDHRFVAKRPPNLRNIMLNLGVENSDESEVSAGRESSQIYLSLIDLPIRAPRNEVEIAASHSASDDHHHHQQGQEDVAASPNSPDRS